VLKKQLKWMVQYSLMNIAIQGEAGSFHEQAAYEWFGSNTDIYPCMTFAQEFDAYENGDVDAIVVAVENTIYGSINEVYPLIEDCSAPIIGEVKLQIAQQLIGFEGVNPEQLTEIYSHPVALAQCKATLQKIAPNAELIEFYDTAGAVAYVKEQKNHQAAAIAGIQAAKLHQMHVLARDIQDDPTNLTRFLVLADQDSDPGANRSSLVITTAHKAGALAEVLNVFAKRGINLEKLQSQPIVGKPWTYKFYVVVDVAGEALRQAVEQIEMSDHEVTLLGEYKAV
jgi:prephenate dehydratase